VGCYTVTRMSGINAETSAVTSQLAASGEAAPLPPTRSEDPEILAHPDRSSAVEKIPEGGLAGIRASRFAEVCLHARGLTKRYQGTLALSDVSLDLKKGEIFGLMGPNGAGKTTLLRILSTLTKPDSGEFKLNGIPHTNARDVRRSIGFTNDVLGVYDDMLVGEYLEFFARASGVEMDLVSYAVDETLELVDLLSMKNQPVDGLSRGMKQRLAFSRAIIAKPSLLLLDEPASGLDPLARLELKELLLRLAREGTTVVLSSHVLEDLAEVSHRIGVLRNGVLIRTAETKELVKEEGSRRLRLQVSERGIELFEFLDSRPDVSSLRWDDQDIVFRWVDPATGGAHPGDPSEFLVAVVTEGFKVRSFLEEKASLENAYLHIAEHNKGKVVA
jgi:ABC-2 type transport system ATP-binding protein